MLTNIQLPKNQKEVGQSAQVLIDDTLAVIILHCLLMIMKNLQSDNIVSTLEYIEAAQTGVTHFFHHNPGQHPVYRQAQSYITRLINYASK